MKTISTATKQAGLTLVELMVALVLTIVLLGAVIMIHLSSRDAFLDAEQLSRIQENVRFASDYLIRDIRTAGYRDEGSLRAGHEVQIREQYMDISEDGSTLTVRYAGRGHCTQAFEEFRLVENEYSVNAAGELSCRGRSVAATALGDVLISGQSWDTSIGLVKGLSSISFQKICPDGGTSCECDLVNDFDTSCIGVSIGMEFDGLRDLDNPGTTSPRTIELTAAFRNIVLDRVNAHAFAEEES